MITLPSSKLHGDKLSMAVYKWTAETPGHIHRLS